MNSSLTQSRMSAWMVVAVFFVSGGIVLGSETDKPAAPAPKQVVQSIPPERFEHYYMKREQTVAEMEKLNKQAQNERWPAERADAMRREFARRVSGTETAVTAKELRQWIADPEALPPAVDPSKYMKRAQIAADMEKLNKQARDERWPAERADAVRREFARRVSGTETAVTDEELRQWIADPQALPPHIVPYKASPQKTPKR